MNTLASAIAVSAALGLAAPAFAQAPAPAPQAPVSGMIASGAPKDITLEVKTAPDGGPILSATEFRLVLGSYYRFNFVCTDAQSDTTGFHLEFTDLLANAHLRVVSINQMEIYLQGQTFRAIECDRAGTARISFHPMRKGTYELYVRNHDTPPKEGRGKFIVE
jgi:hypothetical protein